ncbi:MAG TPA: peptidyl-prolyl cis-trans isomerase [Rhodopila sp.]|uniref:peptidylprolyl isomerase n=1 Tax=Rhodopila sp. TaxID=2480087 RepID=UPI002B8DCF58|nr:peptidyl-prolyl cis-trans isomerase [Rhodopila sp.]HVY17541.1 peptidyl-prolyl cis-trans isomerase [Rhodopila sp.]
MISSLRRLTESWPARIFFGITAIAFIGWGIGGNLGQLLGGQPTWVAKVDGETIDIPAFQAQFQRAVATASAKLQPGQDIGTDQRRQIGEETLNQMIGEAVMTHELSRLRVVTPNAALLAAVQGMPAFQNKAGQFDKAQFETILQRNGFTEDRFLNVLRADVAQRQLLSAVDSNVAAPDTEVKALYETEFEKRSVDMADFPLSAAPEPAAPADSVLHRWYDNHPDLYRTPEYRRIKAVELSPESLASEIKVTDDELHAYYDQHNSEFVTQPLRSAQVISAPDEAKAQALATKWRGGADWAAMQQAAQAGGASAIEQDNATPVQFPDPDLAKAVFSATAVNAVSDPVKGALGWFVVKVTKIVAGGETTFDQAKDTIRNRVVAGKATDLLYERANKVDQLLGNGASLDDLPGDLGLVGVTGTLDADGNTETGTPAPIPGPAALRAAIVKAAFDTQPNTQPELTEVPTPSNGASAYYALVVEAVTPPGTKPYDAVKDSVLADWKDDQRRRAENVAATAMMTAVQGGKSFSDAATVAGVTPHLSPLLTRDGSDPSVPPTLVRVMFGLKPHEATMVETANGFVVAQLVEVRKPDAAKDKAGYEEARSAVARSIGNDVGTVFAQALRERANPRINQRNFDNVVQPH